MIVQQLLTVRFGFAIITCRMPPNKNPAIRGGVQSGGESLTKLSGKGIRRGCALLLRAVRAARSRGPTRFR
jgi:hypothetical protein